MVDTANCKAVINTDEKQSICLLNDAFPPIIDGVSNAVLNYANILHTHGMDSIVITPEHPDANDAVFPYSVLRYPSMDLRRKTGYMAGIPFSREIPQRLQGKHIRLLHSHCPIVSTMLGRELRQIFDVPLILTYHTKFDVDIANILHSHVLQSGSIRALVENISACDEVWAVSQGAKENLYALGYTGDCVIMRNGVDFPQTRVSAEKIHAVTCEYDLPEGIPVFLYVGRMRWYKGLRMLIQALAMLKTDSKCFRMVFIGDGLDMAEVKGYAEASGIGQNCIFTGEISEREVLRAWFCRSNLFLFPSTFDTNGLVVREAAACALASVLVKDSCAAESVTDGWNGFLTENDPESLYCCLGKLLENPAHMASVGENASRELYISWETAVKTAMERYETVIQRYNSGEYAPQRKRMERLFKANGDLMAGLASLQRLYPAQKGRKNEIQ